MTKRHVLMITSAALIMALPCAAQAQSATPAATTSEAEDLGADDIIVTATRRSESINSVPATLDVLSGEKLSQSGITDSLGLQYGTTGLTISRDQAVNNIYIRGIGSSILGIATGNSVATYLDGVFIPNSVQVFQPFSDVERLEVLKGPQATLYGRNATGGAINIITSEPSYDSSASLDASYGNYDALVLRGTVNVPVAQDRVAVRLSALRARHDGYTDNLIGGRNDAEDRWGVRGALRFDLGEDVRLLIRGDYGESHGTEGGLVTDNPLARFYVAPYPIFPAATYVADPRKVRSDVFENSLPTRDAGLSATLTWNTGIGELKLISSYRDFNLGPQRTDLDGTEFNIVTVEENIVKSKSYYNELLFTSDFSDRARLVVGGTFFTDNAYNFQDLYLVTSAGAAALVVDQIVTRWVDTKAYSAYADGEFDLAEDVTLLVGLRYSKERKDFIANNRLSFCVDTAAPACVPAVPAIVPNGIGSKSWDDVSPRFGIRYRPNRDLMLYATATKGFKSGGFNIQNAADSFNPETIWAYEAGVRASLLDRRFQANASFFYYDYTDLQVNQLNNNLQVVIDNASSAKLYGVDLSLNARPVEGLELGLNVSLLHSEFGNLVLCNDRYGPCPGAGTGVQYQNIEGNVLPQAPKATATLSAGYTVATPMGDVLFYGEAYHRSRTFFTQFEDRFASQPGYWLFNARTTFTLDDGRWNISLWGKNLTNRNVRDGINISGVPPFDDNLDIRISRFAPPRTFGATVGVKF